MLLVPLDPGIPEPRIFLVIQEGWTKRILTQTAPSGRYNLQSCFDLDVDPDRNVVIVS